MQQCRAQLLPWSHSTKTLANPVKFYFLYQSIHFPPVLVSFFGLTSTVRSSRYACAFACVCIGFYGFVNAQVPPNTYTSTGEGQRATPIETWSWDRIWFHATMDGKEVISIWFVEWIHDTYICVCMCVRERVWMCVCGSSSCFITRNESGLYACMYMCVCVRVRVFSDLCAYAYRCVSVSVKCTSQCHHYRPAKFLNSPYSLHLSDKSILSTCNRTCTSHMCRLTPLSLHSWQSTIWPSLCMQHR